METRRAAPKAGSLGRITREAAARRQEVNSVWNSGEGSMTATARVARKHSGVRAARIRMARMLAPARELWDPNVKIFGGFEFL